MEKSFKNHITEGVKSSLPTVAIYNAITIPINIFNTDASAVEVLGHVGAATAGGIAAGAILGLVRERISARKNQV